MRSSILRVSGKLQETVDRSRRRQGERQGGRKSESRGGKSSGGGLSLQSSGHNGPAAGIREDLRQRALFLRTMIRHPRQVGAVWPTSTRAVSDLLDLADFDEARTVLEFGAGTGVYTRQVLPRLRPDASFLSFELDPDLASTVSGYLDDPRLRLINDSAEHAVSYLGDQKADILVSSVPFTSLPAGLREDLMLAARAALKPGGRMLVLQYSKTVLPHLKRHFGPVQMRISPVNLPPAFLFACDNVSPVASEESRA